MKELSIEEKAKRYDEAINLVNSKWHYKGHPCVIDVSEIFPELKESNDEKIRKALISVLQIDFESDTTIHDIRIGDIIAWLEKQGNDEDVHLLKLKAKAYDDSKERMSHAYDANRVPLSFANEIFPNLNLYENQDNKSVSETNKIEPKFNIGDWVVVNNNHQSIYQVEKIENGYYILRHTYGGTFKVCVVHDENLRLWTIKDARWGDVLAFNDDTIVIFKDLYNDTTFHSYCHIENEIFNISTDELPDWWECEGFHPATKKQRDLFFQNMKEKGYKWNDNTKEVIKL